MKIENIPADILYAVRQRLGASNEYDKSYDNQISKLSPKQLVARWCGWHLGDTSWGHTIINYYEELKELQSQEEKTQ